MRKLLRHHFRDHCTEAVERVQDWLIARMEHDNNRAAAADILRDGVEAGFSEDQIKRAKKKVGVVSTRDAFGGPSIWRRREHVPGVEGTVTELRPMRATPLPMDDGDPAS